MEELVLRFSELAQPIKTVSTAEKKCSGCHKSFEKLRSCPCGRAHYCGAACQTQAWRAGHKDVHRHPDLDSFLAMDKSFYGHFGQHSYCLADLKDPDASAAAVQAAGKMVKYWQRTLAKAACPDAQKGYWEMRTDDVTFDLYRQVRQTAMRFLLTSQEMMISAAHTKLYLDVLVNKLGLEMAAKTFFVERAIDMAAAEATGKTLLLLGHNQKRLAAFPTGDAAKAVRLPCVLQCASSAQNGIAQCRTDAGALEFQYVMCEPWTFPPRCVVHDSRLGSGPTACE